MLNPQELARFNMELMLDPRFEASFDSFLDTAGKREIVYDKDRFVD